MKILLVARLIPDVYKRQEEFGAKVYNQHADLVAYDNTILKARNVIGAYNPESKRRVLLCAHWDSRPYACLLYTSRCV